MMMMMPALLLDNDPIAVVMPPAVIAVLLLDDDHVPRIRRSACHNRQGQAEGGDGSESEYCLAHAKFSSEVNVALMRKSMNPFQNMF
jgi:hypothetical protein